MLILLSDNYNNSMHLNKHRKAQYWLLERKKLETSNL